MLVSKKYPQLENFVLLLIQQYQLKYFHYIYLISKRIFYKKLKDSVNQLNEVMPHQLF
jgi:hypothetical protein